MLKTIVLIGMMGSGKTSVGKELAKKLNLDFIDIDQEIEKKYEMTISEIFQTKGEHYFRKIEENMSCKLINGKPCVISIGGGSFINIKVRNKIKIDGISIWINTGLEKIYERLNKSKNKRPLLNYKKLKKSIKEIYNKRKPIYKKANYTIQTKSDNKKSIVEKIIKKL
jgi:shikimate kinase